jgi:ABC-type transporter Mla subunit MlaD
VTARHPALFFAAVLFVSAALAVLALWVLSNARTPFDYMVVGTLAAALGLTAAFGVVLKRTSRTARKSGRSS